MAHRVIFKRPENLKSQLFVKATCLKLVSIKPNTDAAVSASNPFRLQHEGRPEIASSMIFGHGQEFYEKPIIDCLSPKTAHVIAILIG